MYSIVYGKADNLYFVVRIEISVATWKMVFPKNGSPVKRKKKKRFYSIFAQYATWHGTPVRSHVIEKRQI